MGRSLAHIPACQKRWLALVVLGLLVLSMAACGGTDSTSSSTASTTTQSNPTPSSASGSNPSSQGSPPGVTPPPINRHGLPVNVPLPGGVSFKAQRVSVLYHVANVHTSSVTIGCYGQATNSTWTWTVAAPGNQTSIEQMYKDTFPNKGWSFVHSWTVCQGRNPVVSACEGSGSQQQVLLISTGTSLTFINSQATPVTAVNAPAGGTVLAIALLPAEQGQTIPGTADVFCR